MITSLSRASVSQFIVICMTIIIEKFTNLTINMTVLLLQRETIIKQNIIFIKCIYCSLLINFANSLDPGKARQNVGPGLDPNKFDIRLFFLK